MPMKGLRYALALISSIIFILMIAHTAHRYLTTPGLSIRHNAFIKRYFAEQKVTLADTPYNGLTEGGVQAKLLFSTNLFQITLLLSAALAGLLIAKDREAGFVLGRLPELAMFICSALLLFLSFVSHALYLNEVSYVYFLAGSIMNVSQPSMPDISDTNINFLLNYQLEYLVAGILLVSFTFLSAHVLKGRNST